MSNDTNISYLVIHNTQQFYVLCCVFCSTSGNTLYEVLEISQSATADEIKRAYRKVSIMLHLCNENCVCVWHSP